MKLLQGLGIVMVAVLVAASSSPGEAADGPKHTGAKGERGRTISQVVDALNARAADRVASVPAMRASTGEVALREAGPVALTIEAGDRRLGGVANCPVDVAVVHATLANGADDVANKLALHPRVQSVTLIDAGAITPSGFDLLAFDAVLTFSDLAYADPVLLGNALADYVDDGGGVVLAMFAMNEAPGLTGLGIDGRFLSDNYFCIERDDANYLGLFEAGALGAVLVPGSPVMEGVSSFSTDQGAFRVATQPHPKATRIANWATSEVFAASRHDLSGRRVDLGFFPVSDDTAITGWDATTDGARLLGNAVVWAAGCPISGPEEGCNPSIWRQPVDPALFSFYSNTQSNPFFGQQVADDFFLSGPATIGHITVWGVEFGGKFPANGMPVRINILSDAAGPLPGSIIYTAHAVAKPTYTGETEGAGSRLYRFDIELSEPFVSPGGFYWLSVLSSDDSFAWAWTQTSTPGPPGFAYRNFDNQTWLREEGQDLAFELCGVCDCACPGDADFDGDVDLDDLQILLFYFGRICSLPPV